jgi:pyruvate/2-oxoglutarate dehydrogenase complex dihydrolipoamide acyltransferase (E2) component
MMKLRTQMNETLKSSGVKISVNDFVIKAASLALKKVSQVIDVIDSKCTT